MINFQHIHLQRGSQVLLEDVTFNVFAKQKIGIVGHNGCGKSSLLAALLGKLELTHGEIQHQNQLRIAHLAQEIPALHEMTLEYVLAGDSELAQVERELKHAENVQDFDAMMRLHTRMADLDGYTAEARAAKILAGLGFTEDDQYREVAEFSGGWRMRLNLARCLMTPADLLLLDEPTNHLDLDAIVWLEQWLKHFPGAVLLISHDREFLDATVSSILHIERCGAKLYTGNYSSFEEQRAAAIQLQNAQHQKQQAQIKHMIKFVDRFRYKATKAKQAQSRLKAIERIEKIAPFLEQLPFRFEFEEAERQPTPLLRLDKVDVGYDADKTILKRLRFNIEPGMRIGLIGANGAGKTTLIKVLAGELAAQSGKLDIHQHTKIGYFDQHQGDRLPLNDNAFNLLQALNQRLSTQEIRNYLGRYGFSGDKIFSPLASFSGGEKSRLALALLVYQKPNLLLLDEPSNHLDLDMREALTLALQSFDGGMVVISHDRHLLRNTVNELWLVANQSVSEYDGSLDDYQRGLL